MTCKHCQKEFNPNDKVGFATPDNDALQIVTECPHCNEHYYTFVNPGDWVPDKDVQKLIASEQAAGRMARPKSIKSRRAVS